MPLGEAEFAAETAAAAFGFARGSGRFQTLEIAIEHEVDYAADGIGAVLGGGATRDDVDTLDEACWEYPNVHRATSIVLDDA